jgi:3-methyladenine DNA glycosylase AlkD
MRSPPRVSAVAGGHASAAYDATVGTLADEIEARLRVVASPERAEHEKRYLKSDLAFLGATMPQIQAVAGECVAERDLTREALLELVDDLWRVRIHERRMVAIELLAHRSRLLGAADLPLLERLVRESRTWALVDGLAASVVGRLVERDPGPLTRELDRWAIDPDFWVRRASLLAELRAIRAGAALDRFVARADPMLVEREFFIRKAIGWVLREAGRRRPDEVAAWLARRTDRASGVTMREAVKYLSSADAERLMAAYREKRPVT